MQKMKKIVDFHCQFGNLYYLCPAFRNLWQEIVWLVYIAK